MKKLMSSRLFGELIRSEEPGFKVKTEYLIFYERLRNNFDDSLSQKLELWMFVPCKFVEGVWVVLEEPKENDFTYTFDQPNGAETLDGDAYDVALKEYQEAKEICIFNNNSLPLDEIKNFISESKTVEFLANYHYEKTGSYLETHRELF